MVEPLAGGWTDVTAPATGQVFARLPEGSVEDVAAAVRAAQAAFPAWSALSVTERGRYLIRLADEVEAQLHRLALAESEDTGKPLALARSVDIPRAAANLRFFGQAIQHEQSESHQTHPGQWHVTLRQPLGVVGCISPWNLPLYLFTWKIAPALAAGNTVVAKPSELTPITAALLGELSQQILPPGVLNIVQGLGSTTGAAIVAHPDVRAISFTGGTRTGRAIAAQAAPQFKKLSLELGGKNATIVFDDADFDLAVQTAARAAFTNQGQICLCGSRILVQKGLYARFREALIAEVGLYRPGDPLEEATRIGALVSQAHLQKVLNDVQLAEQEGGKLLCGGRQVHIGGRCANGYFMAPALIEGLGPNCRTNQEEIFGPVATLLPFEDEAEALALANSTPYGLAASIFTRQLTRAHRMAAGLHTGLVWVNTWMARDLRTPFGGTGQSGVGREGGWEALRFFTEAKNVCFDLGQPTF